MHLAADVMWGLCPQPTSPESTNEVFQRAGLLLRDAFEHTPERWGSRLV